MPIKKIMIDSDIAEQGEELAKLQGYPDLEHYIMSLIQKDYEQTLQNAKVRASVYGLKDPATEMLQDG
jgi:hypothetical protein